jgi:phosphatidylglycerophosphate synthase
MLDRSFLQFAAPVIRAVAGRVHKGGVSADLVTVVGFGFGMGAAVVIVSGHPLAGLVLLLINRVCDGLDGAVARLAGPTPRGAFLDIAFDFLFYAAIPLAFAVADPGQNALPAAVLLAAFIGTGSTFLAFAAAAAKLGAAAPESPSKGFYYLGGLTEGAETIGCFALMCLWPQGFPVLAYGFAGLCGVTIVTRMIAGYRRL